MLNTSVDLEDWQEMNTIAHLNAAFGAHVGKSLFKYDHVVTADGVPVNLNIQHAIMIKETTSVDDLKNLVKTAKANNLEVSEFTREILETTNDNKIKEATANQNFDDVEHLGVLVFGDKKQIDNLTKGFELYS